MVNVKIGGGGRGADSLFVKKSLQTMEANITISINGSGNTSEFSS